MKKLQNNFTTPEQSKRLLELGVPAWTADCFRWDFSSAFGFSADKRYSTSISSLCYEYQRDFYDKLPCWSVGRLIELAFILIEKYEDVKHQEWMFCMQGNLIDNCLETLEAMYNENYDFSKLEE